jgi:hypothetical protein
VIQVLGDANIQGHVARLATLMQADPWIDYWNYLDLRCLMFADVGLDPADSDAVVWERCQQLRIFLLTNNRNDDGPDSLASTIRARNTPTSLPVFTIGDADRILSGHDYANQVIDRLIRYLLEIDNIAGTGRLYLP